MVGLPILLRMLKRMPYEAVAGVKSVVVAMVASW
jgi:hypothetical protein